MASVKNLYYDIESLFIEGANNREIALELDCSIDYVNDVLSTFGVDPEDFDVAEMQQEDRENSYYGA
jgi:hypothetical protein